MSEKKTVKVKTEIASRFGKSIIVGSVKVQFDAEGMSELTIEQAEDVVSSEVGIFYEDQVAAVEMAKNHTAENTGVLTKQVERLVKENAALSEELVVLKEEFSKKIVSLKEENDILLNEKRELLDQIEELQSSEADKDLDNPFAEKTLEECKSLCEEANFPKTEWSRLGEKKIREYLFNKLKEEESGDQK